MFRNINRNINQLRFFSTETPSTPQTGEPRPKGILNQKRPAHNPTFDIPREKKIKNIVFASALLLAVSGIYMISIRKVSERDEFEEAVEEQKKK